MPKHREPKPGTTQLDLAALFDGLDAKRLGWGASWAAICNSVGISASTVTRWSAGGGISAQSLGALMAWFGETDLAPYMTTVPNVPAHATKAPESAVEPRTPTPESPGKHDERSQP